MQSTKEPATITKEKIADQLRNNLGLSALICEDITLHMFSELLEMTENTNKTTLQNFGTWKINYKDSRPGFNIKTGDAVSIEARNVLRFTPAKAFKKQINDTNAD
jgi:nucleoid DNA-binding protein